MRTFPNTLQPQGVRLPSPVLEDHKAAYFGGYRVIGATPNLPAPDRFPKLMRDLAKASPDAILLWGRPGDSQYRSLLQQLAAQYSGSSTREIMDPVLGQVGTIFFLAR